LFKIHFEVTASQIIEEIKGLNLREQLDVIHFAYQLDAERHLTGNELSSLAERMVQAKDAVEEAAVREMIVRGFYGRSNA
jgi:hypothetical protein